MARVFVTGSADGLGQLSARQLVDQHHEVVLHARSEARAREALAAVSGAAGALAGDLASIEQTRRLAAEANDTGRFDAVIHNAGIGYPSSRQGETEDGLNAVFAVNVLAPYLLTALMTRPDRLVYLSSGLHRSGTANDILARARRPDGVGYGDSKLLDIMLAFAVARRWPGVHSNAVMPGWVPTKMGGPSAPDDLDLGADTQAWLAVSADPEARVSGRLFYHRAEQTPDPAASEPSAQDELLDTCAQLTGVTLAD